MEQKESELMEKEAGEIEFRILIQVFVKAKNKEDAEGKIGEKLLRSEFDIEEIEPY